MIIKNVKLHTLITFFACFLISYSLALTTSSDTQRILLFLYGGTPLLRISEHAAFLFANILLQFYNAEFVIYHLKNQDYLRIRYHSLIEYCKKLALQTIVNTTLFFVVSFAGAIFGLVIARQNECYFDFVELICIGFPLLTVFAFAQILLLLFFKESEACGILSMIAFIFAFLSRFIYSALNAFTPSMILKSLLLIFVVVAEIFSMLIVLKRKLTL